MRRALSSLLSVVALSSCTCSEPLVGNEGEGDVVGEGEGEALAVEGEGEGEVVGEGEGEVVGEGEGEVVGEGEGEGEGDDGVPDYDGSCGVVDVAPAVPGELAGEFQSTPGSGFQTTVRLTFPCVVSSVSVKIFDPDFPENLIVAYDGDVEVDRDVFVGDGAAGVLTEDVKVVSAARITHVDLVPDPNDYVMYGEVSYGAAP